MKRLFIPLTLRRTRRKNVAKQGLTIADSVTTKWRKLVSDEQNEEQLAMKKWEALVKDICGAYPPPDEEEMPNQ